MWSIFMYVYIHVHYENVWEANERKKNKKFNEKMCTTKRSPRAGRKEDNKK